MLNPRRVAALTLLASGMALAAPLAGQEVSLVIAPRAAVISPCDDLLVDVKLRNPDGPAVEGYQLFLRFPAELFTPVDFVPEAVGTQVFRAGPEPFGEGFVECDDPPADAWDDAAGEDVVAVAATVLFGFELGGDETPIPPVSGEEVLLGTLVFSPLTAASAAEARFFLNESPCLLGFDHTTQLFDENADPIAFDVATEIDAALFGVEVEDIPDLPAVTDLTCELLEPGRVGLQWSLPAEAGADETLVYREGSLLASLGTDVSSYVDEEAEGLEVLEYEVVLSVGGEESCRGASCSLTLDLPFRRGDVTGDEAWNLSDPVALLLHLFQGGRLPCRDAADFNDDGKLDLTDAVFGLNYLFPTSVENPPDRLEAPFPEPGADPTEDALHCAAYPAP